MCVSFFLDIQRNISMNIKEILYYINLKFTTRPSEQYYWNEAILAHLKMPNYPNNCHDVDISLLTSNLSGFHQVQFNFRPDPRLQVEIKMEDKLRSLTRSYKFNKYGSTGSRLQIMNLTHKSHRYVSINLLVIEYEHYEQLIQLVDYENIGRHSFISDTFPQS